MNVCKFVTDLNVEYQVQPTLQDLNVSNQSFSYETNDLY